MNLPNKLTIFRIFLIPVFLIFMSLRTSTGFLLSLIVFVIASFTDQLDGYIARKYNLITDFGKFMDPLADKLLVSSAFILFVDLGLINAIPVIIIIFREFIITGIRLIITSKNGKVISANMYGKIKTVFQIISIILILLNLYLISCNFSGNFILFLDLFSKVMFYLCVFFTILSGVDYVYKNINHLKEVM